MVSLGRPELPLKGATDMPTEVDPKVLEIWLEWAAAKQIAMPSGLIRPAGIKVAWPEYSVDRFQVLENRRELQLRAVAPSSDEIPIMDAINSLPSLCEREPVRRTIRLRTQIHPIRLTHLMTWNSIAKKLEVKVHIVTAWYKKGLVEIVEKAPKPVVCRIAEFIESRFD